MHILLQALCLVVCVAISSSQRSDPNTNSHVSGTVFGSEQNSKNPNDRYNYNVDNNRNRNDFNTGDRALNFNTDSPRDFPSNGRPNGNRNRPSNDRYNNDPYSGPTNNNDFNRPSNDRNSNDNAGRGFSNNNNNNINNVPGSHPPPMVPGVDPYDSNRNMRPRPSLVSQPGQVPNSNQPFDVRPAFEGCQRHEPLVSSTIKDRHYEVTPAKMEHNSHIAVYPLTDKTEPMYVQIKMPSMEYKAKIQGSSVTLSKCSRNGVDCVVEDEKSTKTRGLMAPQRWNYIYSQIDNNGVTIGIGPEVKVMSLKNIRRDDLENAEWFISSSDGTRTADVGSNGIDGGPFVVQHPCAEYVAKHLSSQGPNSYTAGPFRDVTGDAFFGYSTEPSKHHSHQHGKEEEAEASSNAAIIIGVIVAILIVLIIIAIAVSVYRKRKAFKVTESTPLSEQQTDKKAKK